MERRNFLKKNILSGAAIAAGAAAAEVVDVATLLLDRVKQK